MKLNQISYSDGLTARVEALEDEVRGLRADLDGEGVEFWEDWLGFWMSSMRWWAAWGTAV